MQPPWFSPEFFVPVRVFYLIILISLQFPFNFHPYSLFLLPYHFVPLLLTVKLRYLFPSFLPIPLYFAFILPYPINSTFLFSLSLSLSTSHITHSHPLFKSSHLQSWESHNTTKSLFTWSIILSLSKQTLCVAAMEVSHNKSLYCYNYLYFVMLLVYF